MTKPRTAVYDAPNTPFVLRQFPLRSVKRGEVLVRVTMLTICRSDIHSYEGRPPNPCPGILGHEIIGRIEAIGDSIDADMRGDQLKVGDRITWSEYFFDGQCYYREVLDMPQKRAGVRKYGHDLATEGPHFLAGFAEYCYILPGTWILKLPSELSDEEATPLNCGVATMASVTEELHWATPSSSRGSGFSASTARPWPKRVARGASSVSMPWKAGSASPKSSAPTTSSMFRVLRQSRSSIRSGRVPARWRRRGDRGLRHPGRYSAGLADAQSRRPLRAGRLGQSQR
jgi:hypothetical protein